MTSPNAIVHGKHSPIYNRGNNREDIFAEARNYGYFLRKYVQDIFPSVDTYAYCLLRNHFHLLVRVKEKEEIKPALQDKKPGLVFGSFFTAYAKAFNNLYGRSGSLFENPFGRVEVTSNAQLIHLVTYIHQNPQKHGFVEDFCDWPYSSYHALLSTRVSWLQREVVIGWFGSSRAFEEAHKHVVPESQMIGLVPEDK